MPTELFTVKAAARVLRLRYQVVRRLILTKKMRARRVNGRYIVAAGEIARVRRAHPWRADAMRRFKMP
jgi:hypothetical protein